MRICAYCHMDLIKKTGEKQADYNRRFFCGVKCYQKKRTKDRFCVSCGIPLSSKRKYCEPCFIQFKRRQRPNLPAETLFLKTKGEIFKTAKNWQSARSNIESHARKKYLKAHPHPFCRLCGYDNGIHVAHLKAVASFSNDTTLAEINAIENLIGLCPNHHNEYDKNILILHLGFCDGDGI